MTFLWTLFFLGKWVLADSHLMLSVLPFGKNVVLEESADLNLTCKVKSQERPDDRLDLTWKLPTRSSANGDRITVYETSDQLMVTIHNLQEDDTGVYVCELQNKGIIWTRKISVFVRSKKCKEPLFDCGSGLCISKHYVCDGYVDCPSSNDESFKLCGPDACHGKILCDGRCIPKELCCDPTVDVNCSVNYLMPCCHKVIHPVEMNSSPCTASEDCHFGRYLGFGNSILYIAASCAVVVMVVSAVVMFLACRICSRRDEEFRQWSRVPDDEFHRQSLPVAVNQDTENTRVELNTMLEDLNSNTTYQGNIGTESHEQDFVLMNFVPGYGFEVADCGPKPPPYTENNIGIPPPPYESTSDIMDPDKDSYPETCATTSNDDTSE